MREGEPGRVQELAPEAERRDPVRPVADDWQLDRSQMNANLMCSSRLETDAQERVRIEQLGPR